MVSGGAVTVASVWVVSGGAVTVASVWVVSGPAVAAVCLAAGSAAVGWAAVGLCSLPQPATTTATARHAPAIPAIPVMLKNWFIKSPLWWILGGYSKIGRGLSASMAIVPCHAAARCEHAAALGRWRRLPPYHFPVRPCLLTIGSGSP